MGFAKKSFIPTRLQSILASFAFFLYEIFTLFLIM